MISKIKKTLFFLRCAILKLLIRLKVPMKTKAPLGEKNIIFHDIADSYLTEKIALHGFEGYEYELGHFIKNYPFEFKSFIDAGANIGFYATLVRGIFDDKVSVTAIEAFPNNVRYMEELQKNNNFSFDIIPCALAENSNEDRQFYVPTTHRSSKLPPAASLVNNFTGGNEIYKSDKFDVINVKTISMMDVLKDLSPPHLIKIDIEGYELPVLQSMKEMLAERDDIDLIVEIMINDKDKKEVFDLLIECGYHGYLITNAGLIAEDRPLTLPYHNQKQSKAKLRTCWKNHYFTKKSAEEIHQVSIDNFGYFV